MHIPLLVTGAGQQGSSSQQRRYCTFSQLDGLDHRLRRCWHSQDADRELPSAWTAMPSLGEATLAFAEAARAWLGVTWCHATGKLQVVPWTAASLSPVNICDTVFSSYSKLHMPALRLKLPEAGTVEVSCKQPIL